MKSKTKRKYFFFDIDGTLTDRATNQVVPSAKEAIRLLQKNGHFCAINTGRAAYKGAPVMDSVGVDNMICNGGRGLIIDRKLVRNIPLDFKAVKALYDQAVSKGYGVLVAQDNSIDVWAENFDFIRKAGERLEPTRYIIDRDYVPHSPVYKMYIAVPPEEEANLPLLHHPEYGALRFEAGYLIIQPDEKKNGILRMLDVIGGDPEETVVFGDDTNDLDMFSDPFYKIAMGNGHPDLKAAADEVAPKNVDDGIYKVCKAHGWIE
jgi:Cof subfamily protein (haloacid dehalogenase superfamily)